MKATCPYCKVKLSKASSRGEINAVYYYQCPACLKKWNLPEYLELKKSQNHRGNDEIAYRKIAKIIERQHIQGIVPVSLIKSAMTYLSKKHEDNRLGDFCCEIFAALAKIEE